MRFAKLADEQNQDFNQFEDQMQGMTQQMVTMASYIADLETQVGALRKKNSSIEKRYGKKEMDLWRKISAMEGEGKSSDAQDQIDALETGLKAQIRTIAALEKQLLENHKKECCSCFAFLCRGH